MAENRNHCCPYCGKSYEESFPKALDDHRSEKHHISHPPENFFYINEAEAEKKDLRYRTKSPFPPNIRGPGAY